MKEFDTLSAMQSSKQTLTGLRIVARDLRDVQYLLTEDGYVAATNDVTLSNGRVAARVTDMTTEDIINNRRVFLVGATIDTIGYYDASGGGAGQWVRVDGSGSSFSSPSDTANAIIYDGIGQRWDLVAKGGVLNVDQLGARGDCTGVGVGTDDSPVYRAALNWLGGANFRGIENSYKKRYRIASACPSSFLTGRRDMLIDFKGPVTPDASSFTAFSVKGMRDSKFHIYAYEGGTDADYTQVEPAGGSKLLEIRACRRCQVDLQTESYLGRVVQTYNDNSPFKLSFLDFHMNCGDITTSPGSLPTGQAGFFQGTSAFGGFRYINCAWNKYMPIFDSIVDCVVEHAEFGPSPAVLSSWEWRGCGSIWLGKMLYGDESGTQVGMLFTDNASGTGCRRVDIDTFFSVDPLIALKFENSETTDYALHIKNFVSRNAVDAGLVLANVKGAEVNVRSQADNVALRIEPNCRDIKAYVFGNANLQETVVIGNDVSDTTISGISRDASQAAADTYACARVNSVDTGIVFDNFNTRGASPSGSFELAVGSEVTVRNGRLETQPPMVLDTPRSATHVQGYKTHNSGTATILSGTNAVVVNHGLAAEPESINLTGRGSSEVGQLWYSSTNATSFNINVPANVTADRIVSWEASTEDFDN